MKTKKCAGCKERYERLPDHPPFRNWCSTDCAITIARARQAKARADKEKAYRKETKRLKESIKSKGQWTKEAQAAFNKFIRARDRGQPCISCDRVWEVSPHLTGQIFDAGHYRSTGSMPTLRFEELNCHSQCVRCNRSISGNVAEYRIRLVKKIGVEKLEWLEGPHETKKCTIDDLKAIKEKYNKLARELENENNSKAGGV